VFENRVLRRKCWPKREEVAKESVQVRGALKHFGEGLLAPRPTFKLEDIQYIHNYLPYLEAIKIKV
jgi:hypothetical protein